jgi:hypothetical protein
MTQQREDTSIACLEGCGRIQVYRGVCLKCRVRQDGHIKQGRTTDEQLVRERKRYPSKRKQWVG